eukprot:scaffold156665_cov51-Attheya_sp.AAC.1
MAKTAQNGTARRREPPHSLVVLMPSSSSFASGGEASGCQNVVKHLVQGENWIRIVGPSAAAAASVDVDHSSGDPQHRWSISVLDNQEAANVMCMGTAEDALVCVDVDGSAMAMKDMRRKLSPPPHAPQSQQNVVDTPHVGLLVQRRKRRRNKTHPLPIRRQAQTSGSTGYDSDDENDQNSSSYTNTHHQPHHERMDLVSGTEATNVYSGVKETTTTTMTNEEEGGKNHGPKVTTTTTTSGNHNHNKNRNNENESSSGNKDDSYGALEVLPRRQLRLLRHGDRIVARFGLDESLILEYRLGPLLLVAASLTTKKVPKECTVKDATELDSTSGD